MIRENTNSMSICYNIYIKYSIIYMCVYIYISVCVCVTTLWNAITVNNLKKEQGPRILLHLKIVENLFFQ